MRRTGSCLLPVVSASDRRRELRFPREQLAELSSQAPALEPWSVRMRAARTGWVLGVGDVGARVGCAGPRSFVRFFFDKRDGGGGCSDA
jgi:hypothetical protein